MTELAEFANSTASTIQRAHAYAYAYAYAYALRSAPAQSQQWFSFQPLHRL